MQLLSRGISDLITRTYLPYSLQTVKLFASNLTSLRNGAKCQRVAAERKVRFKTNIIASKYTRRIKTYLLLTYISRGQKGL